MQILSSIKPLSGTLAEGGADGLKGDCRAPAYRKGQAGAGIGRLISSKAEFVERLEDLGYEIDY